MTTLDVHRANGPDAWAPARTYTCQRCGAAFEARSRTGARWCRPCKRVIELEQARQRRQSGKGA